MKEVREPRFRDFGRAPAPQPKGGARWEYRCDDTDGRGLVLTYER